MTCPGLSAFAAGLEGDLAAVTCGLTTRVELRADRGPSEPQQNGERQMFGRAGLPLLR
jgi:hypothetical protein